MIGPGKYDAECTVARESTGGEVILVVMNGNKGSGFSAHLSMEAQLQLPSLLRQVADQIEGQKQFGSS